jgi:ribosomal-protein-alanine N-acetyltransferase
MQHIDHVRTDRLFLTRITSLDIENLSCLYGDAEVMAMLGGSMTSVQIEVQTNDLLRHWAEHGFGPWVVRDAVSDRFIGIGCLLYILIDAVVEVHVGYALGRELWGQGFATEFARASIRIGFSVLGFPALVSFTAPSNLAARRVMEKVGFSFERDFTDKKGVPQVLYRLTRNH